MISEDTCRAVVSAYRDGDLSGWSSHRDGSHSIRLADVATIRRASDGTFEFTMGREWIPVRNIEWRSGIHIRFDGGTLIVDREVA